MTRTPLLTLAATALLALCAGCGGDDAGGSSGHGATALKAGDTIGMQQLKFDPEHVEVKVGQQVTWRNGESVPHDVVANEGADFKSKSFGKDGTFAWTPTAAGTVKYECTLHPGMDGQIDVVE